MSIFDPLQLGDISLANRIIMAPMTRSRAGAEDEPTAMMGDYYTQRASAGLIISEGVYPSIDGKGYVRTPGIVSQKQIDGWADVTRQVHQAGGKIVMQMMHCGRVASHHNKPANSRTLAPSAIQAKAELFTDAVGMAPIDPPLEMTASDIAQTIEDHAQAAENAMAAGFDGVELHATSGYLMAQFLSTGSNQRRDEYGGSLENRLRFPLQVLDAICARIGAGRVGMRICPGNPFNDLSDENPTETFAALLQAVSPKKLAYMHVIRMDAGVDNIALAREHFDGPVIVNESYTLETAEAALAQGDGDAVSFGRLFIANPDLVTRFKSGAELAKIDFKTLYTTGPEGYTDYPSL